MHWHIHLVSPSSWVQWGWESFKRFRPNVAQQNLDSWLCPTIFSQSQGLNWWIDNLVAHALTHPSCVSKFVGPMRLRLIQKFPTKRYAKKFRQLILSNTFCPKSGVELVNRQPGCACIGTSILCLQVRGSNEVETHSKVSDQTLRKKFRQLILSNNFCPKSGVELENRQPGCACIGTSILCLQVRGSNEVETHSKVSDQTLRKKI